jgi:glycosyltransferase involved in cell wall biosynthesis
MFQTLRNAGVKITFTVYDLLPIQMPQMFPPGTAQTHEAWFAAAVLAADGALCISQSVAREVEAYAAAAGPQRATPLRVDWFHLGADLEGSVPTGGVPADAAAVLASLRARPSFLMVGTVEPRKGHAQTLAGFEQVWARGVDANLVVVGKLGWMMDALCVRLRAHPEAGRRLFWIEGASDEYLQQLYGASLCLVAASEGEGFGLPLIEGAQHGLPIIARDIPVFREVAGEFASYFRGDTGDAIADAVQAWLGQWQAGTAPLSTGLRWQTWRQSARQVVRALPLAGQEDLAAAAGVPDAASPRETC